MAGLKKRMLAIACAATLLLAATLTIASAEQEKPDKNALVTYGYIEKLKSELKQELLAELSGSEAGTVAGGLYADIDLTEGQTLTLAPESEIIYRGGGAVVITSSQEAGDGIMDMSTGTECFSGGALTYGHVYYASESTAKKCILAVGQKAYFTVRGSYEIS